MHGASRYVSRAVICSGCMSEHSGNRPGHSGCGTWRRRSPYSARTPSCSVPGSTRAQSGSTSCATFSRGCSLGHTPTAGPSSSRST